LACAMAVVLNLTIVADRSSHDVYTVNIQLTLRMAKAAVAYFFLCVSEKGLFLHLYELKSQATFCKAT
jgi:preprotein translocase subunit SecB